MFVITTRHYLFAILLPLSIALIHLNQFESIKNASLYSVLTYLTWQLSAFFYSLRLVPKKRTTAKGKAVLITGCDTGFGHMAAIKLAKQGYFVFAACLSAQSDGAKKLESEFAEDRLAVVPLDVTKQESVEKCRSLVEGKLRTLRKKNLQLSLWAIVNNAGIMSLFEVEFGDMVMFERQMEVNCLGVVRVTKAFLPLLRTNRFNTGRIVNVSSLAGRFTLPGFLAYCMSKAPVIVFSDGLRRELAKWNIDVVCIEPHLYKTDLVNQARMVEDYERSWKTTTPEIQQAYGRQYWEGFIRVMDKGVNTARHTVDQVVDCFVDAVTFEQVEPYYQVMRLWERIRIWYFQYIAPTELVDYLIIRFINHTKPAQQLK